MVGGAFQGPMCRSRAAANDGSMTVTLVGGLVVLALLDSTSIATLVIPIWLLLGPGRVRPGRMLLYLGTVVVFYAAVGILLLLGAINLTDRFGELLNRSEVRWAQLAFGIALVILSFRIGRRTAAPGGGRLARWRTRAMGDGVQSGSLGLLVALALAAAGLEVATMLPYLAAIGMISASGLSAPLMIVVIGGYCLVMVLPALVLLTLRIVARTAIEPVLTRISNWMIKNAAGTTAWIVGIVGFLIARDAAFRVDLFERLGALG